MEDAGIKRRTSLKMDSGAMFRRFQRTFIPGTIGLQPEDEDAHYKRLQRQPIDTSQCEAWGTYIFDFANGREIYISAVDGHISVNSKQVFPVAELAAENAEPFKLEVTSKDKTTTVIHDGKTVTINGAQFYPQPTKQPE